MADHPSIIAGGEAASKSTSGPCTEPTGSPADRRRSGRVGDYPTVRPTVTAIHAKTSATPARAT
jgi:hypothetical protein